MREIELRNRLADADAYFTLGLEKHRWDIVEDAIRIRCRILCEAGMSEYAAWKNDAGVLRSKRRP